MGQEDAAQTARQLVVKAMEIAVLVGVTNWRFLIS